MLAKSVYTVFLLTAMLLTLLPSLNLTVSVFSKNAIPLDGQIMQAGLYDITGYTGAQPIRVTASGAGLTGTHSDLAIIISNGVAFTLRDADLRCTRYNTAPISIDGMNCKLMLLGDSSVKADNNHAAGIHVPSGTSLLIKGPGSLRSEGSDNCIGIGGNMEQSTGGITIQYATVYASGGCFGDAINDTLVDVVSKKQSGDAIRTEGQGNICCFGADITI